MDTRHQASKSRSLPAPQLFDLELQVRNVYIFYGKTYTVPRSIVNSFALWCLFLGWGGTGQRGVEARQTGHAARRCRKLPEDLWLASLTGESLQISSSCPDSAQNLHLRWLPRGHPQIEPSELAEVVTLMDAVPLTADHAGSQRNLKLSFRLYLANSISPQAQCCNYMRQATTLIFDDTDEVAAPTSELQLQVSNQFLQLAVKDSNRNIWTIDRRLPWA